MSTRKNKVISRRLEEYIEAIYTLKHIEGKKVVRIKDIANKMSVSMASVTDAMKRLSDMGFVEYEKRGYVDLTEKGLQIAENLFKRENIIKMLLCDILGIDEETAQKDACKMEHELSDETIEKILRLVKFLKEKAPKEFLEKLKKYVSESSL